MKQPNVSPSTDPYLGNKTLSFWGLGQEQFKDGTDGAVRYAPIARTTPVPYGTIGARRLRTNTAPLVRATGA